jgi:hypothetical protein
MHLPLTLRFLVLWALGLGCGDDLTPITCCRDAGTPADVLSSDAARTDAGRADSGPMDADPVPSADAPGPSYDDVVLDDRPIASWRIDNPTGPEPDLTGNGNLGIYSGQPGLVTLPNGDAAVDFDGNSYLTVPSRPSLSIPTTGSLTWEAWVRPDALDFEHPAGYVNWMGKCASYSPTCEWEARLYDTDDPQGRCDRLSAYAFNPTAGFGAGAEWQQACGQFLGSEWHHVVGQYTILSQPADCPIVPLYPGIVDIWVDGVEWSQASHNPTGCMSQYSVVPGANDSPLNIGASAPDNLFNGAIGKVAIYGYLLTPSQIASHYRAMTGHAPSGSCADTCTVP